jgi:hypothetical protein
MLTENFKRALAHTKLIRQPSQKIETFWNTEINYLILSELSTDTSCLRDGIVICAKPRILSRESLQEDFAGFSQESVKFAELLSSRELSRLRLLGYKFQNKLKSEEIQTIPFSQLLENVQNSLKKDNKNIALLSAPDDIWSLSLIKVIVELVSRSFLVNMEDLEERGFFKTDEEQKRSEIEQLFAMAVHEKNKIKTLGAKLQEYNLFKEYEERFFKIVNFHN